MKKLKVIVTILLVLILIPLIAASTFVFIMQKTVLNKEYIIGKLENNNYYDNLDANIKNDLEGYIGPSGLDDTVLQDIYTKYKLIEDVNTVISNIYIGIDASSAIETESIKTNLKNNIASFLNNDQKYTAEEESINEFVDQIAQRYEQDISYSSYINQVKDSIQLASKMADKYAKYIYFATIVLAIAIIFINLKKYKIFKPIGIGVITSGLLMSIMNIFVNARLDINNIVILNNAMSTVVVDIIKSILKAVTIAGIAYIIGGFILIVIGNILTKDKGEAWKK